MSVARSRSTAVPSPADSLMESRMEFVGQARLSKACNLLGVPSLSCLDVDDDEGEVVIGIRPKSSPLPRRRSSVSDEDSEPEPALSGSRRVSFADAKGLSLVQVKEFDTWDVPALPGYDSSEGEGKDAEEYFLSPHNFSLPLPTEELCVRVRDQKMELEKIELLPGTTIVKGMIRVLNISFDKAVYIRTTLDDWSSHFDLLAEYIPALVTTPAGTFWANNNNKNYVLFCHQRMKDKLQKENTNKKSCLKTASQSFASVENISALENVSAVSKNGEEYNMATKQSSDGQSGTSEEDRQKLQVENRRNSSRRNRRKAARMARVRDFFAQRNKGAEDAESPPEAKEEAKEEKPKENHPDVLSYPESSSKSEHPLFDSETWERCTECLLDALRDASPTRDSTSVSEPKKSESNNLADSTASTAGESATDISDRPLHSDDEPNPAECTNISGSVSEAVGKSQTQGTSYKCANSPADEPADSVISAVINKSLVSQTTSFTFGTVVAPLYHQMFGRAGSESQSVAISFKAVGKEQGGQLEEARIETTPDTTERKREEPQEEPVEELTATGGGGTKAEDDDVEEKDLSLSPGGEEALWEIVAGDDLEDVDRELVQAPKTEEEVAVEEENVEEENPNNKEKIVADEAGDSEVVDAAQGITIEDDGRDEVGCYEERLDVTQHKAEDDLSAPVSVQDKSVIDKEKTGGSAHIPTEMHLYKEEDFQSGEHLTHDRSKAKTESCAPEGDVCIFTDEPENDQTSQDSTSEESDSDDEVELYMHCLRAVHAGEQAAKDRNKDTGQSAGKRPSVSRGKLLSTPMPSISESLDEEQQLPCLHEDMDVADLQPSAAAVPLS
ncbi:hypothetical protein INR49_024933, partial [Caranx melampygus]